MEAFADTGILLLILECTNVVEKLDNFGIESCEGKKDNNNEFLLFNAYCTHPCPRHSGVAMSQRPCLPPKSRQR